MRRRPGPENSRRLDASARWISRRRAGHPRRSELGRRRSQVPVDPPVNLAVGIFDLTEIVAGRDDYAGLILAVGYHLADGARAQHLRTGERGPAGHNKRV